MPPVTNEAFLRTCFGTGYGDAHVCAFAEDPGSLEALGLRNYWAGSKWSRYRDTASFPVQNSYFTISRFHDDPTTGAAKRRKVLFRSTHVIVVDDVGTKVDTAAARNLPAPSWVLETSPGNYQWGYILDVPETDAGRVNALLDGMIAAGLCSDGKDPGMKGVTRYVRLPQGRNTKTKYGAGGFACVLAEWHPSRRYTMDALAAPWGIVLPAPGATPVVGVRHAPVGAAQDDPIFALLNDWGMLSGARAADGEGHDMTCPWVGEHTDRTDTGTAYWLGGGFKCHHGHCEQKGREDIIAWVDATARSKFGFGLAGLAFKDADKALIAMLGDLLAAGLDPTSRDVAQLALVPDRRKVDLALAAVRAVLGRDVAPVRRALARARKRLARDARRFATSTKRAPAAAPVALPAGYVSPVPLAEAQAAMARGMADAFGAFDAAVAAGAVIARPERGGRRAW